MLNARWWAFVEEVELIPSCGNAVLSVQCKNAVSVRLVLCVRNTMHHFHVISIWNEGFQK